MSMPKARAATPTPVNGGTVPPKASLKIGSQLKRQRGARGDDTHGLGLLEREARVAGAPVEVDLQDQRGRRQSSKHLEDALEPARSPAGLERGVDVGERELGLGGETVRELELRVPAACRGSATTYEAMRTLPADVDDVADADGLRQALRRHELAGALVGLEVERHGA